MCSLGNFLQALSEKEESCFDPFPFCRASRGEGYWFESAVEMLGQPQLFLVWGGVVWGGGNPEITDHKAGCVLEQVSDQREREQIP